jgi:hypothetical protein
MDVFFHQNMGWFIALCTMIEFFAGFMMPECDSFVFHQGMVIPQNPHAWRDDSQRPWTAHIMFLFQ